MSNPISQKILECKEKGMNFGVIPDTVKGENNYILICISERERTIRFVEYELRGKEAIIKGEDTISY